ncbi:MAG: S8 family serine peptidase [Phenylobacterium sp.]|uniref:S8 family serine peptidase n=1 Tax=Phenylobacterium sp. TaxID=1871053 RepID=UPI001A59389A|nr:S8 family serine peptidase [Phenylobacterium sp.]MBL8770147.1 S8 family serine peptidase [Phenylobacterium sp.]
MRPSATDSIETLRRQAVRREAAAAAEAAALQTREVLRQERAVIAATYERDLSGRWHRRGEIVVAADQPGAAEAAQKLGLKEIRREVLPAAGLTLHTFAAPAGMKTEAAFLALKAARPDDAVDLNFVYVFQAVRTSHVHPLVHADPGAGAAGRLAAVIDTALPEGAPALAGVALRARRFGPGVGRPSDHALAVAAVLADTAGRDGLVLLAADVSEPGPLPGASATAIAQALDWTASYRVQVINISLAGPPNAAIAAVVRRIAARGVVIVAAAGNGGPRATAPFPAALPEVLGVTAVDSRLRIWRRATQGSHVDFAAPGVKIRAAGGEWTGTSLAAPVVTGLLLRPGVTPASLAHRARDLGDPGRDPVFGHGYVASRE